MTFTRNSEEIKIFEDMLVAVKSKYKPGKKTPRLCGFLAVNGRKYSNELMVIGRAVNGWKAQWDVPKTLLSKSQIFEELKRSIANDNGCAMSWVTSVSPDYNANRSQFWNTIKRVLQRLEITSIEQIDWPSHLTWSNLYRIAPMFNCRDGKNPTTSLSNIQYDFCVRLLEMDIKAFLPKRILFLTGYKWWAEKFLERLKAEGSSKQNNSCIEYVGNLRSQEHQSKVVVIPHPQGKALQPLVDAVCEEFNRT